MPVSSCCPNSRLILKRPESSDTTTVGYLKCGVDGAIPGKGNRRITRHPRKETKVLTSDTVKEKWTMKSVVVRESSVDLYRRSAGVEAVGEMGKSSEMRRYPQR
jgi:hypothetical protein